MPGGPESRSVDTRLELHPGRAGCRSVVHRGVDAYELLEQLGAREPPGRARDDRYRILPLERVSNDEGESWALDAKLVGADQVLSVIRQRRRECLNDIVESEGIALESCLVGSQLLGVVGIRDCELDDLAAAGMRLMERNEFQLVRHAMAIYPPRPQWIT